MHKDHSTMTKTETLDTKTHEKVQVAALLGYGKPQILDAFKNTLPNRLYWILFPIHDLRLAVEMAKQILTKEKTDRQLVGQSTLIVAFMKVSEGYHTNKKAVSFNTQDRLDDKIDKLTSMMSKLSPQGDKQDKRFKHKIYHGKRRGQAKHTYDQGNYQTRNKSISGDRRTSFRGRCNKIMDRTIYRITEKDHKVVTKMTSGEEPLW